MFAKCGVIKEDDERRPRVKVYRDRESGMPKGDGLVTYLKDPSVCLPCTSTPTAPQRLYFWLMHRSSGFLAAYAASKSS